MAFVALGAPAQNGGGGQSAGRDRGRDRAEEFQQWFMSGRTPVTGSAADRLRQAFEQKRAETSAAGREGGSDTSRFLPLQWTSLGPVPLDSDPTNFQSYGFITGRVNSVAVDQKDPTGNTVYIGTANGGVWKSINAMTSDPNAVTWQPLTDAQASLAVGAVAIQPGVSGTVILAGTGEANQSSASYYGMGILRSTDGGQSWSLLTSANSGSRPFRGLGFSRIAFHGSATDLVVASAGATNGSSNGADAQGPAGQGIYVSLDAGQSWNYASVQDAGIAVQPSAVSDVVFNPAHNKFYAAVKGHGYYESVGGQGWNRMAQQPGAGLSVANCPAAGAGTCPLMNARLAVRPDNGETYTAWVDANNTLSLYKLPSNGAAWQAMGAAGIVTCGDVAGCGAEQGNANLALHAVINVDATDLYFGAVNLFKCTASVLDQLCTTNGAWKNLTHAYGCSPLGAPAHVHPGQHEIAAAAGSLERVYFVNDGGVYRTRSGFTLQSGSCTATNAFESLNANLGPLSSFTSLAQPVSDPGILLGGAVAVGTPLLHASNAGAGGLWRAANLGDGGHTAIDPADANVLYSSFPAGESLTIQRCVGGVSCRQNTWANVADSASFAHDGAALFAPYMLDPRNPSALIVGTCRVWRGPASGGTFTAISGMLAGNGGLNCGGGTSTGETKVRSLAAGGPAGVSGGAKVIYAGMFGRSGGAGGRIFVTTDADAGTWTDRTGDINPNAYDISDIAISPHDATGQTAYAAVMGFGAPHIFKSTNAGISWTNRDGNLPDVPVTSLTVDPENSSLLYAGTDLGVYVSADDGGTWAVLGQGLPNVPVSKLLTFVAGGVRKLRAATFGRGVWQIELPVVAVKASPSALTLAATVVGRVSPTQVVTLTNDSASTLSVSGVSASGPFVVAHDCAASLPVGAACHLEVRFLPSSSGAQSGSVTVNHATGLIVVPLSATGVNFNLQLSRPVRPPRGASNEIVVAPGQRVELELNLGVDAAGVETDVRLSCSTPALSVHCSLSQERLRVGSEVERLILVLEGSGTGRRSMRLSLSLQKTYMATVRAEILGATKIVEVPFKTR